MHNVMCKSYKKAAEIRRPCEDGGQGKCHFFLVGAPRSLPRPPLGQGPPELQNCPPRARGCQSFYIYVFFFVRSLWNHRAPQFPRGGKGGIAELFREENSGVQYRDRTFDLPWGPGTLTIVPASCKYLHRFMGGGIDHKRKDYASLGRTISRILSLRGFEAPSVSRRVLGVLWGLDPVGRVPAQSGPP